MFSGGVVSPQLNGEVIFTCADEWERDLSSRLKIRLRCIVFQIGRERLTPVRRFEQGWPYLRPRTAISSATWPVPASTPSGALNRSRTRPVPNAAQRSFHAPSGSSSALPSLDLGFFAGDGAPTYSAFAAATVQLYVFLSFNFLTVTVGRRTSNYGDRGLCFLPACRRALRRRSVHCRCYRH